MNRVDGKVKKSHGVDEDTKDAFIYHSYLKAYKPNPQPIGRKDYPQVCGSTKKVRLTLNLLQEIHLNTNVESVKKNLKNLKEIDISVSGGGLKGYFCTGVGYILYAELARQGVKINRISGSSAGAFSAWFMTIGLCSGHWLESYFSCQRNANPDFLMHENYTEVYSWLKDVVPKNSYELCNNRLFIHYTVLSEYGLPVEKVRSTYTSNEDIFEACLASSSIPYITYHVKRRDGLLRYHNDIVFDGGFTKFIPLFEDEHNDDSSSDGSSNQGSGDDFTSNDEDSDDNDNNAAGARSTRRDRTMFTERKQLVIDLGQIDYPLNLIVHPNDLCIEILSLRGAIMATRFLEGKSDVEGLYWYGGKTKKESGNVKRSAGQMDVCGNSTRDNGEDDVDKNIVYGRPLKSKETGLISPAVMALFCSVGLGIVIGATLSSLLAKGKVRMIVDR